MCAAKSDADGSVPVTRSELDPVLEVETLEGVGEGVESDVVVTTVVQEPSGSSQDTAPFPASTQKSGMPLWSKSTYLRSLDVGKEEVDVARRMAARKPVVLVNESIENIFLKYVQNRR